MNSEMNHLNVVIPVKDPGGAKERLSPLLTPGRRRELALFLFEQTLNIFKGLSRAYHLLVVTDSPEIAERARALSVSVLEEEKAAGETQAVERATAWSVANNFASQLVVPADLAHLDPADLAALLNHPRPNPSVILSPATGEDGTNAILTTPPNALAFRFGVRSFPDYRRQAAEKHIPCHILRLPSLVLDLDTPEDLQTLLRLHPDHPVTALLEQWQIPARS